jgi:methionine salvage enolase-phosphatase E1
MTPCSLLDDEITNNILLDLSVKASEEYKEEEEEKEDIQEEIKEKSYKEEEEEHKEDIQEEHKEDIQEEVKETSILNVLSNVIKLFFKYVNEIIKAGTEPLYNDIDKS